MIMTNQQQTQPVEVKPEVRQFLEQLMKDAGFIDVLPELKEELFNDLVTVFNEHMMTTIVEELPADKLLVFNKLQDEGKSKEEIEGFLLESIENAPELFADALLEFRDTYLQQFTPSK